MFSIGGDLNSRFEKVVRPLSSSAGFGLVEIIIATVLMTAIALGATSLFTDMFTVQKRADVNNAIVQQRLSIINAVLTTPQTAAARNDSAWERTVQDATINHADFGCLRSKIPCKNNAIHLLDLKGNDGNPLFYALSQPGDGFTPYGAKCTTFSLTGGNPNCPFHFRLEVAFHCVDGTVDNSGASVSVKTECLNPQIEVNGDLLYSPGPKDIFEGQAFRPDQFKIRIRRGDSPATNTPIVIAYNIAGPGGEGSCSVVGVPRKFNKVVNDPGGNVTVGGSLDSFTLQPGAYECRVQAPAFKSGGVTITLQGGSYSFSSSGIANQKGGSTTLSLQAALVLSAPTTFQVIQKCETLPSIVGSFPDATNDNWSLGVPVPALGDYSSITYSVVTCMKTG